MTLSRAKILIVDDQIGNITLLSEILDDLADIFFCDSGRASAGPRDRVTT